MGLHFEISLLIKSATPTSIRSQKPTKGILLFYHPKKIAHEKFKGFTLDCNSPGKVQEGYI
jgi:hypothetical protein